MKFTVEERAARFQRRYTGPWKTTERQVGPVVVTYRARRRTRLEYVQLAVAGHDLSRELRRGFLLFLIRITRWRK